MNTFSEILVAIDDFVWGPAMLILLVGTGIVLTVRTRFLPWRNLGYAIRSTLSKEARTKSRGSGDVSPFAALTTALAATIGTGNIVGVATAMVAGGPGALVWMWISAAFGITSKFSECMLAIKYREVNEKGEMSGGPMYTMRKALKPKRLGVILGWLFALFAVTASFGIGNLSQANSISDALKSTFSVPTALTGAVITLLALFIIVGGIKSISKVSSVVVPFMAIFYVAAGLAVIIIHIRNVPSGLTLIFSMAFSARAVTGGVLGTIVASMMRGMRFGIARGIFSNEAGMGSAAITAAAATTDDPVRQGYINMTGTFWDTIVVCTITGLCIAASGVLGNTSAADSGRYAYESGSLMLTQSGRSALYRVEDAAEDHFTLVFDEAVSGGKASSFLNGESRITLRYFNSLEDSYYDADQPLSASAGGSSGSLREIIGDWKDESGSVYTFHPNGTYEYAALLVGAPLTIAAFRSGLGSVGAVLVTLSIVLFAFSTILGWEYHGEKAWEYLLGTHRYNMIYRIVFSLIVYVGATTRLDIVWNLSDIFNALMAIPNLICLLLLSGEIARDIKAFQSVIHKEKAAK